MSDEEPRETDGLSSTARAMRAVQPWLDLAWKFMGPGVVWGLAGLFADRWLGTSPWLLLVGFFVGLVVGFIAFMRAYQKLSKKQP